MATTYQHDGDVMPYPAPSGGVVSGTPVMIGSLFVVPLVTAAETVEFNGMTTGVHGLAKTSAQAWTAGQKIYWNTGTSKADSDGTTGPLIGTAAAIAANPTDTGYVRLNGIAPALLEGPQAALVDLTDSTGQSGTHDDTLAATTVPTITATNPGAISAAAGEATAAALADTQALEAAVSALVVDVAAILALLTVMTQNASDTAQKTKEIRAILVGAGLAT